MSDWKTMTIAEAAAPNARAIAVGPFGSALTAAEYSVRGVPLLRGQDITDGKQLNSCDRVFVPDEVASRFPACRVQKGDLVFPHRGAIGRVGLVGDEEWLISSSLMKLTVDPTKIDPQFLFYYFRGQGREELLSRASTVGTPGIGQPLRSLKGIQIIVPSLSQQGGIAEVLGALDDKIAANTRLRSASENLLRANFEALGIDTSPVEGTQLHEVVTLNPTTPKPAEEVAVYLEMKHLPDSSMTVTSWSYREPRGGARFVNGDTLLARITPCLENGKTGHVDFLAQGQVGIGSTEYIVMRAKTDTPTVLPYFLATSPAFRDVAIRRMVGTSGRQRLSAADIADYLVSWPSADKLVTFDRLASSLMPRVKAATDETRHLIETRDALLPLLMSGKVSVKDAESVVGGVI